MRVLKLRQMIAMLQEVEYVLLLTPVKWESQWKRILKVFIPEFVFFKEINRIKIYLLS
jgi:hypothetical protein